MEIEPVYLSLSPTDTGPEIPNRGRPTTIRFDMESAFTILSVLATALAATLLLWLFPLKLLYRLRRRFGRTIPCPYAFAWVLDLRLRKWAYAHVLNRVGLRSGLVAVEVGAGAGTFTLPAADLTPRNASRLHVESCGFWL